MPAATLAQSAATFWDTACELACVWELQSPPETITMPNVLAVAGPNSMYKLPNSRPAGFLAGLWHGLIAPLTFVVSLFRPSVRIYETENRGRLYDLGFLIGVTVHGNGRLLIRTTLI